MRRAILAMLATAGALAFSACQGQPPETETVPTPAATTAPAVVTPAARYPTVVAGTAATPFAVLATPAAAATTRGTPSPTPVPGTPTPTATPAPSAGLVRKATALQEKVDAFREAIASGDKDAILKTQRDVLDALPDAEAAAAGDESKAADSFRKALRDLRGALGGDLAKLDSASKGISDVTGGTTAGQRGTATTASTTAASPITNLPQYANDLANEVAAFRKAQDEGNVGDLLRLQNSLLGDIDRGDAAVKKGRTKESETLRGALDDLRNALGGDSVKFDSAEAKLRQVASSGGTTAGRSTTTTAKQTDLQPVANELSKKLDAYQQAVANKNEDEIKQAQQALADQVNKAQAAAADNQSPRAQKLREALGALREAASGDQSKIDAAKSALEDVMSAQ